VVLSLGKSNRDLVMATTIRAYHIAALRQKTCHESLHDDKAFSETGLVCA
jgi:hypothetical protein